MKINLRLFTSLISICVLSAVVVACSGTKSSTETDTSVISPTAPPIKSETQPPAGLPSKSQIQTPSPSPINDPTATKLPLNESKSESGMKGDQIDVGIDSESQKLP